MSQALACGTAKTTANVEDGHGHCLDPADWEGFRKQAHQMLDHILDYTQDIRQRPVWQPIPTQVRQQFQDPLPYHPTSLSEVNQEFRNHILPYAVGNVHPGFMGWVHGGGTPVGLVAEMLAAGLNANLGGRDQAPVEIERQVGRWMRELFGFPETANGLFVTGTSMANFIALVIARNVALGSDVRQKGLPARTERLTAYASSAVHGCIARAMDLCGLGRDALRLVPGRDQRLDMPALASFIKQDREAGRQPFLIVGTAGTVDTGAIDDLAAIAKLARSEKLWFHVDGAYGALAMLAPELAPKLCGIEQADSLAFDFHKWGQVPYDAGFLLVRDGELQRNAFAAASSYLRRETRGMAAGSPWPCDYGPDLSRGFRALKTWFTFKVYGAEAIGRVIAGTCRLARYLEQIIASHPELELLAPVELNIVCFRYRAEDSESCNARIVIELQESGIVAPSTTTVDGKLAIRVAIVNHRTTQIDIDRLVEQTLSLGRKLARSAIATPPDALPQNAPAVQVGPTAKWEESLRRVDKELASKPTSKLRLKRASLLSEMGRLIEARDEYIRILQHEPHDLAALNNLGCVLIATGHRKAAAIAYKEAVLRHPDDTMSRLNLGYLLLEDNEQLVAHGQEEQALENYRTAREQFERVLQLSPGNERAHEGLSLTLGELGDAANAEVHRQAAFRNRYLFPKPYRGNSTPVSVLLLVSTTGGNVRLQKFLDDRVFQVFGLCPEFYDSKTRLPAHQLIVNAIGDAEVSEAALRSAQSVLSLTGAPVINPPAAVLATGRSDNATRLSGIVGAVTPITVKLSREQLSNPNVAETLATHGIQFPILLRAPGFHTGLHFARVNRREDLRAALEQIPGPELIVIQFLDARGSDGKTRKYRAMMINGQLYPLHCAISSQWKIHYFTAEMADNPVHRAEDAAFLDDMPRVVGELGMKALHGIQAALGLDYAGIDFGLNAKGEVLVFEANATMVVNPPEAEERWSYRRPAYERIRAAIHRMFLDRACGKISAVQVTAS